MSTAIERPAELAPKYRIGTVVQLTGLTADTVRAWERRYGLVRPVRSDGGTRLYSDADVTRLQLAAALTETGHAIGSLAGLDDDALRARLAHRAREGGAAVPRHEGPLRVAVLDPILAQRRLWSAADAAGLEVVHTAADPAGFEAAGLGRAADVVVAHLRRLGPDPVEGLTRCLEQAGARMAVVVYEFASRRQLKRLTARGARLLRGPVGVGQLARFISDLFAIEDARRRRGEPLDEPAVAPLRQLRIEPPARRISDTQLARLCELRSDLDCECPNHLAQIVTGLAAFERYSKTCQDETPEDTALHTMLARSTGHARALMEELLLRVCEHDGVSVRASGD
jgi:hypothetical protein